jgi:hypothetical protein
VKHPPKAGTEKVPIEPGADKRLANILKKALNTPPRREKEKSEHPQKKGQR